MYTLVFVWQWRIVYIYFLDKQRYLEGIRFNLHYLAHTPRHRSTDDSIPRALGLRSAGDASQCDVQIKCRRAVSGNIFAV
jgi:hypothetical protein